MASTAIVWFRRDLRVHDHPALRAAASGFDHVLPVFVLDDRLLHGRFASGPRTTFMLGCLEDLDASLRDRGAALHVAEGRPEDVLPALAADADADAVLWTSDVSPFARARDGRVTGALREAGVDAQPHPGNYIAEIAKVRTKAGDPFTVFSPFHRAWMEAPRRDVGGAPRKLSPPPSAPKGSSLSLPYGNERLDPQVAEPAVAPGETAGRKAMNAWVNGPVEDYERLHDSLAGGTSMLSPYLRWGCISPRELEERVRSRRTAGPRAFRRQLAWRDFYAAVLLANPGNVRDEYQERYRGLEWDDDPELLEAWQEGRTGYPLVDAAMRQLARTGWMHNRARLVVGSFLTKDLHLDWRHGEAWFERLLLDGEPAQNNGNWQWVSSVGVDPAPYFRRMFNPVLQQRKFDPDGEFVRRWVPELRDVPLQRLFEPWAMSGDEQEAAGCVIGRDYPEPVVDHQVERRVSSERFRQAAEGTAAR